MISQVRMQSPLFEQVEGADAVRTVLVVVLLEH